MSEFVESVQILPKNNIETLKTESASLLDVYNKAVEYDPRLVNIKIIPITLDENTKDKPFFASKPWKTTSGKAEVHVLFGKSESIGQIAINSIIENPVFEQQFRSWTYLRHGEKISPQLARAYIFLHELGHITDYYDHINDPEAYDTKTQMLKDNLPLGNLTAPGILRRYRSGDIKFQQKVKSNYGTLENAVIKYRQTRHELSFEKKADEFAHKVLQHNPTTLTALANNLYEN